MTAVALALLRLAGAGLICGGLLALGGTGSRREILRFGCACLMVILVLDLLRQADLPEAFPSRYEAQVREQVDAAQEEGRRARLEETALALSRELERQAAAMELDCAVEVDCQADETGLVTVQRVTVCYRSGPRSRLQELRQSIAAQLAVPADNITIREETVP